MAESSMRMLTPPQVTQVAAVVMDAFEGALRAALPGLTEDEFVLHTMQLLQLFAQRAREYVVEVEALHG